MTDPSFDRRRVAWIAAFAVVALCAVLVVVARHNREPSQSRAVAQPQRSPAPSDEPAPLSRFIAVAGGATPDSNPISLEQNLALAHAVLPGPGVLLFGSGPQGATVQVLDPTLPRDPLLDGLGELFSPRAGRDSRYDSTSLPAARASEAAVRTELSIALSRSGTPLLLYMSGHGEQAEEPRDNVVQLWGGDELSAFDLADLHDRARGRRALRTVITSCFSGGFAELAFKAADPARGASFKTRCGLFATTWDLESSGCDPNPDRAAQEGYSLHFFNALRGMDRDGVTPIDADYDDDGVITLLEAHARARIAGRSIDVPTTTSERFLREHVTTVEADSLGTPEDDAVISALGTALSLQDEDSATRAIKRLEADLDAADQALVDAQDQSDAAYNAFAMSLLERWPVLDDPYHPLFAATVRDDREAILKALSEGDEAQRYAQAQAELHAHEDALQTHQERYALHLRLVRAYENRHLAASLKRQGGKAWNHYQGLLTCERGLP